MTATQPDVDAELEIDEKSRIPWGFATFLIVAGGLGWWAAFSLINDKISLLADPTTDLDCNFSFLVQCGKNLESWQGSVFGFPNPLLGLGGFVAPIAVGVALLAGAKFARWFWILFNVGVAGAFGFVLWLIGQSIYAPNLHVLCPWCMLVWSVTIPLFYVVTFRNLAEGRFGDSPRARRVGAVLMTWVVPITVVSYLIVALLAQFELNILRYF
jgi:uncharacterized membrane protein